VISNRGAPRSWSDSAIRVRKRPQPTKVPNGFAGRLPSKWLFGRSECPATALAQALQMEPRVLHSLAAPEPGIGRRQYVLLVVGSPGSIFVCRTGASLSAACRSCLQPIRGYTVRGTRAIRRRSRRPAASSWRARGGFSRSWRGQSLRRRGQDVCVGSDGPAVAGERHWSERAEGGE